MSDEDMLRIQNRALERENRQLRRNLRDEFAMAALPGVIAESFSNCAEIAGSCYRLADAMLEARK